MLELRRATTDDARLTYEWARDPLVRENSYSIGQISWEDHQKWFSNKLASSDSLMLVFCEQGKNVGLVRFDRNKDHFIIGITVDRKYRGKGISSNMIVAAIEYFSQYEPPPVYAYIKKSNPASAKTFSKAGFVLEKELNYLNTESYLYIWK